MINEQQHLLVQLTTYCNTVPTAAKIKEHSEQRKQITSFKTKQQINFGNNNLH